MVRRQEVHAAAGEAPGRGVHPPVQRTRGVRNAVRDPGWYHPAGVYPVEVREENVTEMRFRGRAEAEVPTHPVVAAGRQQWHRAVETRCGEVADQW